MAADQCRVVLDEEYNAEGVIAPVLAGRPWDVGDVLRRLPRPVWQGSGGFWRLVQGGMGGVGLEGLKRGARRGGQVRATLLPQDTQKHQ